MNSGGLPDSSHKYLGGMVEVRHSHKKRHNFYLKKPNIVCMHCALWIDVAEAILMSAGWTMKICFLRSASYSKRWGPTRPQYSAKVKAVLVTWPTSALLFFSLLFLLVCTVAGLAYVCAQDLYQTTAAQSWRSRLAECLCLNLLIISKDVLFFLLFF